MLNRLFDKTDEEVLKFLPYFDAMRKARILEPHHIEEGFSALFKVLPDIESDFPRLPVLLSQILIHAFVNEEAGDLTQVKFAHIPDNPEEDFYMADIVVKVIGVFTHTLWEESGGEKAEEVFNTLGFKNTLSLIREFVMQENVPEAIGEEFGVRKEVQQLLS